MITLRPHQQTFIDNIRKSMLSHKHIICQAVTSFGKTYCFSYIAQNALKKGSNVLILSNRSELLTQAGGALANFGMQAEYISPKHRNVPTGKITVSMLQTLQRRYQKPKWDAYLRSLDLIIIDEAHFSDSTYLLEYDNPNSIGYYLRNKYVLGFTATPLRTGKMRQLGLDYDDIVLSNSVQEMLDMGYLSPARTFSIDAPDLSKVEKDYKTGDYNSSQLGVVFNKKTIYTGLIKNYNTICPGTKAVCFCASQLHSIQTCVELNNAGISAMFLISGIDAKNEEGREIYERYKDYTYHKQGKYKTREELLKGFDKGEYDIICNSSILSTGWDCPSVRTVILNRATTSQALFQQMIGRACRLYEGKSFFYILDLGNNIKEHGGYEADRKWSLWHLSGGTSGIAPVKECPNEKGGCGRIIPVSAIECSFCHYKFENKKQIRDAELVEIIGGNFKFTEMNTQQLLAYAELHNYHKNWVFNQIYINNSESIFRQEMRKIGYDNKFIYVFLKRKKDGIKR